MHINGLVQDCSNSIANALELLQSCTKTSIYASVNWKKKYQYQVDELVQGRCNSIANALELHISYNNPSEVILNER